MTWYRGLTRSTQTRVFGPDKVNVVVTACTVLRLWPANNGGFRLMFTPVLSMAARLWGTYFLRDFCNLRAAFWTAYAFLVSRGDHLYCILFRTFSLSGWIVLPFWAGHRCNSPRMCSFWHVISVTCAEILSSCSPDRSFSSSNDAIWVSSWSMRIMVRIIVSRILWILERVFLVQVTPGPELSKLTSEHAGQPNLYLMSSWCPVTSTCSKAQESTNSWKVQRARILWRVHFMIGSVALLVSFTRSMLTYFFGPTNKFMKPTTTSVFLWWSILLRCHFWIPWWAHNSMMDCGYNTHSVQELYPRITRMQSKQEAIFARYRLISCIRSETGQNLIAQSPLRLYRTSMTDWTLGFRTYRPVWPLETSYS